MELKTLAFIVAMILYTLFVLAFLFHGMSVQTFVPLYETSDQEGPASPKGCERRLILGATVQVIGTKSSAQLHEQVSIFRADPVGFGRTVKPSAPIRFQNPMCHPNTLNAGMYHFRCVSNMKSIL